MTICYFGRYAREYSRNAILISGLEKNGVKVIECNDLSDFIHGGRYLRLIVKFLQNRAWESDIILVGFPGQSDVPLAWFLAKITGKKLVFDAFYSWFVSQVFDRKNIDEGSWKAHLYFFIDWLSCFLADKVILDTQTHIDYFVKTFKLPKRKFIRIFVGTDPDIIKPIKLRQSRNKTFKISFHGSFLPLQGVPIIIAAANMLRKENIIFTLLGGGIEFAQCQTTVNDLKLNNVKFLNKIPYNRLAKFISQSDLYLGGPFGNSLKSNLVIPNKVFEALAVGKPVILGESRAMRELLVHKLHGYYVRQGSAKELAKAILFLKNNKILREKMGSEGYNLIRTRLYPKRLGQELIHELNF